MDLRQLEGEECVLPSLGHVHVSKVFPNGAAHVDDDDGKTWLVPADLLDQATNSEGIRLDSMPSHFWRKDQAHVDIEANK